MVNPTELATLRDIHLPSPIGWWPLAPGWCVLMVVSFVVFSWLAVLVHRRYIDGRAKREAQRILSEYQKNNALHSANIASLLKRVALAYYPRVKIASLQGDAWIAFLNDTSHQLDFNQVRDELLLFPYQSSVNCDVNLLFNMASRWIRQRGKPCSN